MGSFKGDFKWVLRVRLGYSLRYSVNRNCGYDGLRVSSYQLLLTLGRPLEGIDATPPSVIVQG